MTYQSTIDSARRSGKLLIAAAATLLLVAVSSAQAADPEFVGMLDIAAEDEVADRLGLSDEVRQQLDELIDQRIKAAVPLALSIKDLPPVERSRRLQPFVEESEKLGMRLLTIQQRSQLNQLRLQRRGMATLAEADMAQLLQLSDEQTQEIRRLMDERAVAMTRGGETEQRRTRDSFERALRGVLTATQKATWDQMAGLGPGPQPGEASSEDVAATEQGTTEQATTEQATTEQATTEQSTAQADEAEAATAQPAGQQAAAAEAEMADAAESDDAGPAEADTSGTPEQPAETMDQEAAAETEATEAQVEEPAEADPEAARSPSDAMAQDESGRDWEDEAAEDYDPDNVKLRFNFRFQPWGDVLDWLAEQADLSLQSMLVPEGTFNYSDTRQYTPTEAIDLINGILLPQGYTLVRRGRLLMVMDLEDEVPDVLVEFVPVEKLDERGEFELVKTVFHLAQMEPSDVEQEIGQLLGPGRSMVVMPKARQILVTETAGKLRMIRDVIERAENPTTRTDGLVELQLEHISPEELLGTARGLLGLGEGEDVGDDIAIAQDSTGTRLFANGSREKIKILEDLAKRLDQPREVSPTGLALEQPQLMTHYIRAADPNEALAVLQTLLAGLPDVRMSLDVTTNKIIALAPPSVHKTIQETIKQLEGQAPRIEVIQLKNLDPQMAVVAIGNFFSSGEEEGGSSIKIDADPITMRLYVRGTESEIAEIKSLIEKLEGPAESSGGTLRFIPMGPGSAESAVETARQLWLGPNKIELLSPADAEGPSIFDLKEINPTPPQPKSEIRPPARRETMPSTSLEKEAPQQAPAAPQRRDKVTLRSHRARQPGSLMQLVSFQEQDDPQDQEDTLIDPSQQDTAGPPQEEPAEEPAQSAPASEKGADIRIEFTQNGILIASEDTEALDKFEALLRQIAPPTTSTGSKNFTVYFLKYAKADVAAQLISDILGGTTDLGGGGSLVGDVASSLMGGGGGILGALLGGGGGAGGTGVTTVQGVGTVAIVPDARLNCLVVQGMPVDLQLIEQLLKVIDREGSITDIQTAGKPHIIPIIYMNANDVATVVREAYADRIAQSRSQGGRGGQPDPAELIRALRGGGSRGGRGGTDARSEAPTMTVAVDATSNSLIVTAPEQLYQEVRELVYQIDQSNSDLTEDVVAIPLKKANPEAVQKALASIMGAQTSSRSSSSRSSSPSSSSSGRPTFGGGSSFGDIQSRIDAFRRMRESGAFGGPSSSGGFGGRPGGFGGGPPSSGGRGGTSSAPSSRGGSTRGGSTRGRGR